MENVMQIEPELLKKESESLNKSAELSVVPNYPSSPQQISTPALCHGKVFSDINVDLSDTYELLFCFLVILQQVTLQNSYNAHFVMFVFPFVSLVHF